MKFPELNYVILFVFCLAFIIPGVSAGSHTLVLVSGSDTTQSAGYTVAEPSNPLDAAGYGGIWSPAVVVTDGADSWYASDLTPFGSNAAWVSSAATREGGYAVDQWRLFKHDFNLPTGSTITSAQLAFTADNAVTAYLNGVQIGSTPSVIDEDPTELGPYYFKNSYIVSFTPAVGSNTLQFVVPNWKNRSDANPTGLLYKATIEYTVEDYSAPEFPSMLLPITLIIGLLGSVLYIKRTREH